MAKDRNYICEYYISYHNCAKGKEAEFGKICQKCPKYKPRKGAKPARVDNRKTKLDKIQKQEARYY